MGDGVVWDGAPGNRFWQAAFLALIVVQCVPFWAFQYFPSQDGPSHLYNAVVLANYANEPLYREYYRPTPFQPAGNMLAQGALAMLVRFTPPLWAEKLLLSGYVVLLFYSFRYVLRALSRAADHFALFAGILAPNVFLYMGFWNFCLSVSLLLFVIGYYLRRRAPWRPGALLVLVVGGLMVYLAHAVSWVVCVVAISVLGLPRLCASLRLRAENSPGETVRRALWQYALPIGCVLVPAIFIVIYLGRSQVHSTCAVEPTWRKRLWPLYSLSFLHTIFGSDNLMLSRAVAAVLLAALLVACGLAFRRRQYNWGHSAVLAVSGVCAVIAAVGPNCVGSGGIIQQRVVLHAWVFFVIWLAGALVDWPRKVLNVLGALFCGIALIVSVASLPWLSEWNERLAEVAGVGEQIRPRSTVLMVNLERPEGEVDPYRHAIGLLFPRTIIDLGNYEAYTDHFLTRFQPERSPSPALGKLKQLEAAPPVFDIRRYERETQGRVDYLLFRAGHDSGSGGMERLLKALYGDQLAPYAPVLRRSGRHGTLLLYQRVAGKGAPVEDETSGE